MSGKEIAAFHSGTHPFNCSGVQDRKDYHHPTEDFANTQPEFYVGTGLDEKILRGE